MRQCTPNLTGLPNVDTTHMTPQTLTVPCKINLFLRITGVLSNGYHTLDTLFIPLRAPHDVLHVEHGVAGQGLVLSCFHADASDPCALLTRLESAVPCPSLNTAGNTLHTAYTLYAKATGFAPDMTLTLIKGIPTGAGLGGGSADAATLLRVLQAHAPRPLPPAILTTLAARVGADVPFFLHDGPCRATGIGDVLTPIASNDLDAYLGMTLPRTGVLIMPDVTVSTPWAYKAYDTAQKKPHIRKPAGGLTSTLIGATSSLSRVLWLENNFEDVVFAACPLLGNIKTRLLRQGACAALMSGSGAAMFGLFHSEADAERACAYWKAHEKSLDARTFSMP